MPARHHNIDALRMMAALSVLFAHFFVLARPGIGDPVSGAIKDVLPLERGLSGQGVAIFFVLSGYLVTASLIRRGALGAYFRARALRIFPALWALLAVTVIVGLVASTESAGGFLTERSTAGYVAHNASLLGMRYELAGVFASNPVGSVNLSLWTLPLEFLMYLTVGALGALTVTRSRAAFSAFVAVCLLSYVLAGNRLPVIHDHHDSELILFFLAGALIYVNRDWLALRWYLALPLVPLVIGLTYLDEPLLDVPIILGTAYAVLWLGFSERVRLPNLAARGDLSYATYLYAALVSQVWLAALGLISPWVLLALTLTTTLPVAYLSWHWVERPALALKERDIPKSPVGASSADR